MNNRNNDVYNKQSQFSKFMHKFLPEKKILEKLNNPESTLLLNEKVPNCKICEWREVRHVMISTFFNCSAQGSIDTASCYNNDMCKLLFNAKSV